MTSARTESLSSAGDDGFQYRLLFDHNPQSMWVFDRITLEFLAVNDAAIAQYGYSRAEFLGMTIKDIRPLEDVPHTIEQYETVGRKTIAGIDHTGIWRHRKKDGTVFHAEIFSSPIAFNGHDASLVLAIDVTERVRAEEQIRRSEDALRQSEDALRRQKHQFTTLVEHIPDIVARLDRELRFLYISPPVLQATGKAPEEYVGKPRKNDGIPPEFVELREQLSRRVFETGQEQTLEFPIETPAGWRHFESRLIPEFAPDGSIESLMTLTRDITDRQRTEEALRESEQRYRSLTQAITSVFWTMDADGRFVTPQPSWAEYTGQTWDELRDFGWINALHPNDRERTRSRWQTACASKTLFESAGRLWHADSRTYRHVETRGVPILNNDGSVREWVGKCSDVEDRTRAETLLACQKQALEMVARAAPLMQVLEFLVRTIEQESTAPALAAIHLLDEAGAAFQQAVAPSLPESYRHTTRINVHTGQGPCCLAVTSRRPVIIADASADPQWAAFAEMIRPLGLRSCWSTPIVSSEDTVLGTVAVYYREPRAPNPQEQQLLEIVTRTAAVAIERRRADQQLRESEARFRTLADAMPQIVWAARPDGYIDYYNERWYEYTGFHRDVHGAPNWEPILHPDDVRRCIDTYLACIKQGQPYQVEYRLKDCKTGGYRWFLGRAVPVRDPQGNIVRWFGTCTDIEDTKRAQESLKDADRRKDEFLATLAHELRNPLAPIRNSLHILRMADTTGPAAERIHEMMERQVHHMIRLVDDLLEVSRITRGKIELRKERVELASVVRSAVETAKPLIEAARHQLAITLPAEPVALEADPVRIAQVLANLLNNAVKYTPTGGQIWLSARCDPSHVIVSVRDNGKGIPRDMLPRVFEMFTQVDRSSGPSQDGLGIGLALCHNLVALHDGRIEAHSDGPGHGSEFVVTLPLAFQADISDSVPQLRQPIPTFTRRVLVVDDNRDAADSLAMLLKFMGADAHVVYDGRSALEALDVFKPHVVLLDIGLPGMDGYEVAHRIRANPGFRHVPLIALTGWGQDEDRRRSTEAGFEHHLVKPVALDTLQTLLLSLSDARERARASNSSRKTMAGQSGED